MESCDEECSLLPDSSTEQTLSDVFLLFQHRTFYTWCRMCDSYMEIGSQIFQCVPGRHTQLVSSEHSIMNSHFVPGAVQVLETGTV